MIRRWLIRTVFMLPILFCVVGWGWSCHNEASIEYHDGGTVAGCSILWGGVELGAARNSGSLPEGNWVIGLGKLHESHLLHPDNSYGIHGWLGLGWYSAEDCVRVYIPFWLLLLIFSSLLFLVWRKTRPKNDPRTAFPVVMAGERKERA